MVVRRHESLPIPNASEVLGAALTFPASKRVVKNRFLKAPLTERAATWDPENPLNSGIPQERHFTIYKKWSLGGFGMINTGNVLVCPKHLEAAGNVIIHESMDSPKRREAFKKWTAAIKSNSALAIAQLSHGGRQTQAVLNPAPLAPSAVQLEWCQHGTGFGKPVALTTEQIKKEIVKNFVYAAKFAHETGFDGVELPVAHGYLLAQFIMPSTNQRTDEYGGSLENRLRVVFEISDAIRKEVPSDFVVGIKVNSGDFQDWGLSVEEVHYIAERIEKAGFDFMEVTGGTLEKYESAELRESTKKREAFFQDFSKEMKKCLKKTVVYFTGGFRTAYWMAKAVEDGLTDGVGLGRPITAEPDLPNKILKGEVLGAVESAFNQNDFGITVLASNTQMYQAGLNSPNEGSLAEGIMDLSDPKIAERYSKIAEEYWSNVTETQSKGKAVSGVLEWQH